MVDVLSTRAHAVYTKWERSGSGHNSPIEDKIGLTPMTTKRYGTAASAPIQVRDQVGPTTVAGDNLQQQARDKDLFRSKDTPWTGLSLRKLSARKRPLMGASCKACTPNSEDNFRASSNEGRVDNILKTETETDDSFFTRTFCHLVHNYKLKKFDYPQVADTVMGDDRLKDAIQTTARGLANSVPPEEQSEEQYKQIFTAQEARARRILLDMRSTLSDLLLRITSWILYKLLPRFLTAVCLHPSQLDMLKRAADTNLPLIFVPLHRSHLDYILITFILLNINVKSPLVAAGNNLRIPVFGWLLRGLGAFFIKRRIDPAAGRKDVVYRAVLHTYMMQCLRAGHNIEFYIEGGRTRTGKPCMPKGGLLSVIIDAYMDGTVEDALLVPVSVNYDKLVDGNFIRELLGQPKQLETFSTAISAIWATLNSNYGSMRIDFNQPFSLKEMVKTFQIQASKLRRQSSSDLAASSEPGSASPRNGYAGKEKIFRSIPSTTSLYGTDIVDEDHRALVDSIARHLIYDSAKACAVMSTNTLAFLLLNKYRNGVRLETLVESFDELRQQLKEDKRDVGYSGHSLDVINNAVRLLGPGLVKREKKKDVDAAETFEVITPVTILPNVIELSYYSNGLLTHFMMKGVLATVVASHVRTHGPDSLNSEHLFQSCLDLCDILQFEFIFAKPCETLERVIHGTMSQFEEKGLLEQKLSAQYESDKWCRLNEGFDSENEDEFLQCKSPPMYSAGTKPHQAAELDLYHMSLRPLVDTYAVTAKCLRRLVDRTVDEGEFVREVLAEIKCQHESGYCPFGESSSVDPIRNALKLFKKWGVLEMFSSGSVKLVNLVDPYNTDERSSEAFARIEKYKF